MLSILTLFWTLYILYILFCGSCQLFIACQLLYHCFPQFSIWADNPLTNWALQDAFDMRSGIGLTNKHWLGFYELCLDGFIAAFAWKLGSLRWEHLNHILWWGNWDGTGVNPGIIVDIAFHTNRILHSNLFHHIPDIVFDIVIDALNLAYISLPFLQVHRLVEEERDLISHSTSIL